LLSIANGASVKVWWKGRTQINL